MKYFQYKFLRISTAESDKDFKFGYFKILEATSETYIHILRKSKVSLCSFNYPSKILPEGEIKNFIFHKRE